MPENSFDPFGSLPQEPQHPQTPPLVPGQTPPLVSGQPQPQPGQPQSEQWSATYPQYPQPQPGQPQSEQWSATYPQYPQPQPGQPGPSMPGQPAVAPPSPPPHSAYPQQPPPFAYSQQPPPPPSAYAQQTPKKSKAPFVVIIVVATVILACCLTAVVLYFVGSSLESTQTDPNPPIAETPSTPEIATDPPQAIPFEPDPSESDEGESDEGDEDSDLGPTKKVGNEQDGYVEVPETWIDFVDVDNSGLTQYSNLNGTQIVTLTTYDSSEYDDAYTLAATLYEEMEATGYRHLEVAAVYDILDYTSYQVYGISPDGVSIVVIWAFEDENGLVHFLSSEGPALDTPEAVYLIPQSFTLE